MESVRRTPLVAKTQESILHWIQSDEIKAGERLPGEIQLSKELGVSRSTVREALRSLQTMGYVEQRVGSGTYLISKEPNSQYAANWFAEHSYQVLEILEVRALVEPYAAALAVERATEAEKITLFGIHAMFASATATGNVELLSRYDEAFHRQLAVASHNKLLQDTNQMIAKSQQIFRDRTFTLNKGESALKDHGRIVEAFQKQDPEMARQAMKEHMEENIEMAQRFIK